MNIESVLGVLKALRDHGVAYVLVGGLAVALHDVPRITEDVDIFVRDDEQNVGKLRSALHSVYRDESIDEITKADMDAYAVIRYGTPDDYYIDIMSRIGEMFSFEDVEFEVVAFKGVPVNLATIDALIMLKNGTLRDKDRADVILLREKQKEKR